MCLWAGLGLAAIAKRVHRFELAIPMFGAFLLVTLQIFTHYHSQDQKGNLVSQNFARAILGSLPENSILIYNGDYVTMPVMYVRYTEGFRPDIKIIDLNRVSYPWYQRILSSNFPEVILPKSGVYEQAGYNIKELLDANISRFPIFVCNGFFNNGDTGYAKYYKFYADGLVDRVLPMSEAIDLKNWITTADANFALFHPTTLGRFGDEPWERPMGELYWGMRRGYCNNLLAYSESHPLSNGELKDVVRVCQNLASENAKWITPDMTKKLAVANARLEKSKP